MDAFREGIVALVPRLRASARALAGGDRHLADDLVQDAVALALRGQGRFTAGTDLRAWLFTILRNRFRSVVTRKHVRAEVAADGDDLGRARWTPAPQEAAVEVRAFLAAFRGLSPRHREALVLTAVEGLPYERVAGICGCRVGTVKSRVDRARAELRRLMLGGSPPAPPRRRASRARGAAHPLAASMAP
jgi:RNA polymerase sigma-70 factor, ECF subfamily